MYGMRWFSSTETAATTGRSSIVEQDVAKLQAPFWTKPQIIRTDDGRNFMLFREGYHPKLKPGLVRRRIEKLRTYEGKERDLRHSKWKLNLICKFVTGYTVEDALQQLKYSKKAYAPVISKIITETAKKANDRHGVQPSQLEIAECFATRGRPVKAIKIMAKGRFGRMEHPRSHVRLVLREIDFQLKIYQAYSKKEKLRWYKMQERATEEARQVAEEKAEEKALELEDKRRMEEIRKRES